MKRVLLILSIGCLLIGCRSEIDLQNVDSKAQVDLGMALPLGSFHITLNDLMGNVEHMYIDNGIITWKDTFPEGRSFHAVNLAERISTKNFALDVYNQLAGYATGGTIYAVEDLPITLNFDMPLKFTGINDYLGHERLDSAYIEEASFKSTLRTTNFPIQWSWIDQVTLDLGNQISRPLGNNMVIYSKGDAGDFNQEITTTIDDFVLIMMKDRHMPPSSYNVFDSTTFKVQMRFTIPKGESITLSSGAKLDYNLSVAFIRFSALWGYFQPSSDMFSEMLTEVGSSWKSIGFLTNSKMPFSNPQIKVDINTQIAGRLRVDNCKLYSLYVGETKTDTAWAEFYDGHQRIVNNLPLVGQELDPHTSPIGTFAHFYSIFDPSPNGGRIDALFKKLPDYVGYRFEVDFDTKISPQVRMTPNDSINIAAAFTLPMTFSEDIYFKYSDTTQDVHLSQLSLDSLLSSISVIDTLQTSNLKLYLNAVNDMPISISLSMRCLNEKGDTIMDPADPTKPFSMFENETYRIESADYHITSEGFWALDKANETMLIINVDKEREKVLPQIRTIIYTGIIDDLSMQKAITKGYNNLSLHADRGVKLKLGLTANVGGILNFENKENANQ